MRVLKTVFLVLLAGYGLYGALQPQAFMLLTHADLLFHEAGHLIFGVFGNEYLGIWGGTLFQLLVPLIWAGAFAFKQDFFAVSVMSWWFGQNFFHIAPYVKDARLQAMPLVGGDIHDWNFLLTRHRILHLDQAIGNALEQVGVAAMMTAVIGGLIFVWTEKRGVRLSAEDRLKLEILKRRKG